MTNQRVHPQYDDVRKALNWLRKGSGIPDADKLAAKFAKKEDAADAILGLPLVRQIMRSGKNDIMAAHEVIDRCAMELKDQTSRVVAQVALALPVPAGADHRPAEHPTLGARREALIAYWATYYSSENRPAQTVDQLRRPLEELAFDQLTELILDSKARNFWAQTSSTSGGDNGVGRVVVIGGLVHDVTFRVAAYPDDETSNEASDCTIEPGGKGFMQAIAAARLGLDVTLLAAVGDDRDPQRALDKLADADVHSQVKERADKKSSWTGIFELPTSASMAVNSRGTATLTTTDIDDMLAELAAGDVLLATFEIPAAVMTHLLRSLSELPDQRRPHVIITPAQPYTRRIDRRLLKAADFLVARRWEFLRLYPEAQRKFPNEELYDNLLDLGVSHVCLMNDDGVTIYPNPTDAPEWGYSHSPTGITNFASSAISRDAFCASLAAHLIENGSAYLAEAVEQSAVAMALASATYATLTVEDEPQGAAVNSLPDRNQISNKAPRDRPSQITAGER